MTDEEFRAALNIPMPLIPVRWNPNTSRYEEFRHTNDQAAIPFAAGHPSEPK